MQTTIVTPPLNVDGAVLGTTGIPGATPDVPGVHLDIYTEHVLGDRMTGPVFRYYSVVDLEGRAFVVSEVDCGDVHWFQGTMPS